MILLNGSKVPCEERFPDGTFAFHVFRQNASYEGKAVISWKYEGEEEMAALYYLVKHIRMRFGIKDISLFLPYCPNARNDRCHHDYEVFTLKYFADFINSMRFERVSILDPHSSVTAALIDGCEVLSAEPYIRMVIRRIGDPELLLFYPDEGAMKRYSDMVKAPYGFGIKRRCWETGEITGLDVVCGTEIRGKNVLIVDDICCRGGTFFYSAKELKRRGAKSVSVFCTHCEHAVFDGELLTTGYVNHIYTTDSIFSKEHEKITVFPLLGEGRSSAGVERGQR